MIGNPKLTHSTHKKKKNWLRLLSRNSSLGSQILFVCSSLRSAFSARRNTHTIVTGSDTRRKYEVDVRRECNANLWNCYCRFFEDALRNEWRRFKAAAAAAAVELWLEWLCFSFGLEESFKKGNECVSVEEVDLFFFWESFFFLLSLSIELVRIWKWNVLGCWGRKRF